MKYFLTILLIFTVLCSGAQETLVEFDKLSSYNISGVLSFGEKGKLFWNAPHPTLTTRKMQRENGINLAFISNGKLIWKRNIKPEAELSEWSCEPVSDPSGEFVYFRFIRSSLVKPPYSSILKVDTLGEFEFISEGSDDNGRHYAHFSRVTDYNIVRSKERNRANSKAYGSSGMTAIDKLELVRIPHDGSELERIDLDLPQRREIYNTQWELVDQSHDALFFVSMQVTDNYTRIIETIRKLDLNGELLEEISLQFYPEDIKLTDINYYDYPHNNDSFKVIEKDRRVWYKTLYKFEDDLIYHIVPIKGRKLAVYKSEISKYKPSKIAEFEFTKLIARQPHTRAILTDNNTLILHSLGNDLVKIMDTRVSNYKLEDNLDENIFINNLNHFPKGDARSFILDYKMKTPVGDKQLRHEYLYFCDDAAQYFCTYNKDSKTYQVLMFDK